MNPKPIQTPAKPPAAAMPLIAQVSAVLNYAELPYTENPLPQGIGVQLLVGPRAYFSQPDYDHQRPLFLSLLSRNSVLPGGGDKYDALEFLVQHPTLQIPAARQPEVLRLLRSYNLVLPFGRLLLGPEGDLQYRYSWLLQLNRFEGALLLSILDRLWFFYDQLVWRIEAVAHDRATLDEMLNLSLAAGSTS